MNDFGHGWDCGKSHGEGLSRVLSNALYPGSEPNNFVSIGSWLDGGRPDWVTTTKDSDQDYPSIGCAVSFLNWLHYQLGYTWTEIAAAGDDTLLKIGTRLLGTDKSYQRFLTLINQHYPPGRTSGADTADNPFSLLSQVTAVSSV